MSDALSLIRRAVNGFLRNGTLLGINVVFAYLKAAFVVKMDMLRSYVQSKIPPLRPTSPTVAALASLGMVYVTEGPIKGGNTGEIRRVYVSRGESRSVITKTVSDIFASRIWCIVLGSLKREVNFYSLVAPTLPVPTPTYLFGEWNSYRGFGLIVMQDIEDGVLLTDDLISNRKRHIFLTEVMKIAARIHAKYWGATPTTLNTSTLGNYPWLSNYDFVQGKRAVYECNRGAISAVWDDIKRAITHSTTSHLSLEFLKSCPELIKFIDQFVEGSTWDAYEKFKKTFRHPLTLIHGDYRLSNQLWVEEESKLYTVDWAEASVGDGPADIAYYFFNYPHISERRQWEHEMVRIYWEELGEQGVDLSSYPLSMCREAYVRSGIDRGIQMLIAGIGCRVYDEGNFNDIFIQHLVEQVDAFVSDHEDEYEGPHILMSVRWL